MSRKTGAIHYQGQRVCTTLQLSKFYGTEEIRIQQNHNRNLDHFDEGKHFHKVMGDDLRDLRLSLGESQISPMTRSLILWTERGAARHAKMLETDKAWEIFEQLEDHYFRTEAQQSQPDPMAVLNDPAAMRGLLLGYTEKVIELEKTVAEQAPAVAGFERIAKSDGSLCVTDAAKSLQVRPKDLTQLLQEKGWIYRRPQGKGYLAYQDKIQRGLMEHKVTTGDKGDGTEWTQTQARVTARGLTTLAEVIRQAGMH
ncbi:MAG: phage antirepressor KilAC domain-containing protein [Xylophilus ampelinus]